MAEKRCVFDCKDAKICQKCKPTRGEFKKALELKSSGLSIYIHNDEVKKTTSKQKLEQVVVYNNGPREANKSEYVGEIKNYGSKCVQCRSILIQIKDLLESLQEVKKDDVTGVCERCKWAGTEQCKQCAHIVNKFLVGKVKKFEERHERLKDWLIKVKYLLNVLVQKGKSKSLDDSKELKRLLQELQRLHTEREPDIKSFLASDTEMTKDTKTVVDALAKQTSQLDTMLSEYEKEAKAKKALERSLFIKEIPDKVLENLGKLTKEKLEKLLGPELTRNIIDQILSNLGNLNKNKAEMLLGPDLTKDLLDTMLTNLVKGLSEKEAKKRLEAMMRSPEQKLPGKSIFKRKDKTPDEERQVIFGGTGGVKRQAKKTGESDVFIPDFIKQDGDKHEPTQKGKQQTDKDKLALFSKKEDTPETPEGVLKDKGPKKSKLLPVTSASGSKKDGKSTTKEISEKGSQPSKKELKSPSGRILGAEKTKDALKRTESGKMIKSPPSKHLMSPSGRLRVGEPSKGKLAMQGIIKSEARMKSSQFDSKMKQQSTLSTGKLVVGPIETKDSKFDIRGTVPMDEPPKEVKKSSKKLFQLDTHEIKEEPHEESSRSSDQDEHEVKIKKPKGKKGKLKKKGRATVEERSPSTSSAEEVLDIQKKPKKLTASTKHLLGLMKKREKEREIVRKARLKLEKENAKIVLPEFAALPEVPTTKKKQTGVEAVEKKEITGPTLPTEMIERLNIIPYEKQRVEHIECLHPLFYYTKPVCPPPVIRDEVPIRETPKATLSTIYKSMGDKEMKGIIRYELSNPEFIDKGWTQLPSVKIMRRFHIYKMTPANPENDWFTRHIDDRRVFYDTGERLAEIDPDGHGRLFYKNGMMALDFYKAEELNAESRYVVYSTGKREEATGRLRPVTMLASFDHLGSGIVYDHFGNERLKYNQTEGMIIDERIGAPGRWKWHGLNDPPDITPSYLEDFERVDYNEEDLRTPPAVKTSKDEPKKDSIIKQKEKSPVSQKAAYEEMIAIENSNYVKNRKQKLLQKFKQFEIMPKYCKINDYFSLKIINQRNISLVFRHGQNVIKLNLGLVLIDNEIVDSENVDVASVETPFDRYLVKSRSVENLKDLIKMTRVKTHVKTKA